MSPRIAQLIGAATTTRIAPARDAHARPPHARIAHRRDQGRAWSTIVAKRLPSEGGRLICSAIEAITSSRTP